MHGVKRISRLALVGGVISAFCCGGAATATAADELGLAWQRQPGTEGFDMVSDLATDADGNLYVVGDTTGPLGGPEKGDYQDGDTWVRKYDPAGRLLWRRQPGTSSIDHVRAVATDAAGNVVLVGWTQGALGGTRKGGGRDPWVRKYDPDGRLLWQRQPGTSAIDYGQGIAADTAGNVFVVGSTLAGNGGWVRKYDPDGRLLWRREPGTGASDEALAVATDADGNAYVVGKTFGSLAGTNKGQSDSWLRKYDPSGRLSWQRQPGTEGPDSALDVAIDASGDVYVVGGAAQSATKRDVRLLKFDSAGRPLWTRELSTDTEDFAFRVATDAAGGVYVTGYTEGSLAGPTNGYEDAWVVKYDAAGMLRWSRQIGTVTRDYGRAVATDAAGNVYVAGETWGQLGGSRKGYTDAWLMKFSSVD